MLQKNKMKINSTSSYTKITSSDTKLTSSDTKITSSDTKHTSSDTKSTSSDAKSKRTIKEPLKNIVIPLADTSRTSYVFSYSSKKSLEADDQIYRVFVTSHPHKMDLKKSKYLVSDSRYEKSFNFPTFL